MSVADTELRDALQTVLRQPVRALARQPHAYGSSHAIEDVEVTFGQGAPLRIVFKDVSAPGGAKPTRLLDPDREAEAYLDVLAPGGHDVPACYGAVARGGRRWLFLEAVDGIPLWQVGDAGAWEAAARWLAGLHARPLPQGCSHLLRYDAAYLDGWLERAVEQVPPRALDEVAAIWERVVARVSAWPYAVVHGDYHPSNVLISRTGGEPRVRPVDWELAGIGPGLLDLAALTSGSWSAQGRERIAAAYQRALPPAARASYAALLDALSHCRLLLAVQWLGWSREWTPPAEHAHDWLAEATTLARELA
ncbi:MAG: aminoglycoside phosphotransferase family protein [Solirubrobacteraceae bacterium]